MKRKMFPLVLAALAMASQAAMAATTHNSRSVGAFPVVYDDYAEESVVLNVGDDVVLTMTGEARTRFEWVENTVDFSSRGFDGDGDDFLFDDSITFAPARFDLGFRVDLPKDVAAVVQLTSAFDFGDSADFFPGYWDRVNVNQHLRPGAVNRPAIDQIDFEGLPADTSTLPSSRGLDSARSDRNSNTDTVHLYQGYIEAAHIGGSMASLRFGRQELAYGTEFLLGNQDWYDGLSYDGIKLILELNDRSRLDLFWAKLAESQLGFDGSDNDQDIYGAYYSLQEMGSSTVGLDVYGIAMKDRQNLVWELDTFDNYDVFSDIDSTSDDSFMSSYWVGVRFFREREHGFHFSAELVYQFGDINAEVFDKDGDEHDDVDIGAWAFESFLGFTWDRPTNPTIKGGLTWASGSDFGDYDSADWNTFFTPAGEIHPRLGQMDLIEASNIVAWNLGYSGSKGNHAWGVDLWYFDFDETNPELNTEFLSSAVLDARDGHGLDDHIGEELDLWYNYQYSRNLAAQFGVGWFNSGDFIEQAHDCLFGDCDEDLNPTEEDDVIHTSDAWRVFANLLLRF